MTKQLLWQTKICTNQICLGRVGVGGKNTTHITQNETVYLESSALPGENLAVAEPVVGRSLVQFS